MHWTVPILCLVQVPTAWAIQRIHMGHGFIKPANIDLLLHQVHAWSRWLILLMALLQVPIHVIATLWHHLYRRDDVLLRMFRGS